MPSDLLNVSEQIDWASLSHAYGPATNVPDLLRALLTGSEEETWLELWNDVHHQGSVYSATAPTVRVLMTWLGRLEVPRQDNVWSTLQDFARQGAELQPEWSRWLSAEEHGHLADIRREILSGLPRYLAAAADQNSATRLHAYALLAELPEAMPITWPILEERFSKEADVEGQAAVLLAQARLLGLCRLPGEAFVQRCLHLLQNGAAPMSLCVAAGRAMAMVGPQDLPDEVVQVFAQQVEATPERFRLEGGHIHLWSLNSALGDRPDLQQALGTLLLRSAHADIRMHAAFRVRELGTEQRRLRPWAVSVLLAHLREEADSAALAEVVTRLGQLGQAAEVAVPTLVRLAEGGAEASQRAAVLALLQLRRAEVLPFLAGALRSTDVLMLSRLARGLADLDPLPPDLAPSVQDALTFVRVLEPSQKLELEDPLLTFEWDMVVEHTGLALERALERLMPGTPEKASAQPEGHIGRDEGDRDSILMDRAPSPEELGVLVNELMETDRADLLTRVLPWIPPYGPQARQLEPLLRQRAADEQFGQTWEQLRAVTALMRLLGEREPYDRVAQEYLDWSPMYSAYGLEQLLAMRPALPFLRAVLERLAFSERSQTGSFGPETVQEDEALQRRAKHLLEELETGPGLGGGA